MTGSRPSPSPPAPRVKVTQTDGGQTVEPILEDAANLNDFRIAFRSAFGTVDELIAEALFAQLLNGLHTDPRKPLHSGTANLALALTHEIAPKDVVEAMLACQMIVAHAAAMDASRRALHIEQTAGGRATYLLLARKLDLVRWRPDGELEFLGRADTQVGMPKPARSLRRDYPVTRRCVGGELVAAACRRMQ